VWDRHGREPDCPINDRGIHYSATKFVVTSDLSQFVKEATLPVVATWSPRLSTNLAFSRVHAI
jgi:hypothetical protein